MQTVFARLVLSGGSSVPAVDSLAYLTVGVRREAQRTANRQRRTIVHLAQGYSISETAIYLGVSLNTVKTHYRRAREKIRSLAIERPR